MPGFSSAASKATSRSYQRPWIEWRVIAPSHEQPLDLAGGLAVDVTRRSRARRRRRWRAAASPCRAARRQIESDRERRGAARRRDAEERRRLRGRVLVVRHVLEEPVLARIALADRRSSRRSGKSFAYFSGISGSPEVVRAGELGAGAIGNADFPELLAAAHGLPRRACRDRAACRLRP